MRWRPFWATNLEMQTTKGTWSATQVPRLTPSKGRPSPLWTNCLHILFPSVLLASKTQTWNKKEVEENVHKAKICYTTNKKSSYSSGSYSITNSYNTLIGSHSRWRIDHLVRTAVAQPKHRLVLWLAVRGRLLTKARLRHLNISIDSDECCLCDMKTTETPLHLFADCAWTKQLRTDLSNWLGIQLQASEVKTVLERLEGSTGCISKRRL